MLYVSGLHALNLICNLNCPLTTAGGGHRITGDEHISLA